MKTIRQLPRTRQTRSRFTTAPTTRGTVLAEERIPNLDYDIAVDDARLTLDRAVDEFRAAVRARDRAAALRHFLFDSPVSDLLH